MFVGDIGAFNVTSAPERTSVIVAGNAATLRVIITNAPFVNAKGEPMEKPAFIFGDSTVEIDDRLQDASYKYWVYMQGDRAFYLPTAERSLPSAVLQGSNHRPEDELVD